MNNEWLQQLKAGDTVFVSVGYGGAAVIRTVRRVTATQIVIEEPASVRGFYETKFSRNRGTLIGYTGYNNRRLLQDTTELREKQEVEALFYKARKMYESINIGKDRSMLEAFVTAIDPFLPKKENA